MTLIYFSVCNSKIYEEFIYRRLYGYRLSMHYKIGVLQPQGYSLLSQRFYETQNSLHMYIYVCKLTNFLKTTVTIIKEMKTNVSIVLVSRGSFDRRLKQGFLATHCQVQLCELLYLEPFMCFKQMDHGHTVLMN